MVIHKSNIKSGRLYDVTTLSRKKKKERKVIQVLNSLNSTHYNAWDTRRRFIFVLNIDEILKARELYVVKDELDNINKLKKSYS